MKEFLLFFFSSNLLAISLSIYLPISLLKQNCFFSIFPWHIPNLATHSLTHSITHSHSVKRFIDFAESQQWDEREEKLIKLQDTNIIINSEWSNWSSSSASRALDRYVYSGVKGKEVGEGRGQQLEYKSRIKKKFIFIKTKKPAAAVDAQHTQGNYRQHTHKYTLYIHRYTYTVDTLLPHTHYTHSTHTLYTRRPTAR